MTEHTTHDLEKLFVLGKLLGRLETKREEAISISSNIIKLQHQLKDVIHAARHTTRELVTHSAGLISDASLRGAKNQLAQVEEVAAYHKLEEKN